MHGEAPRNKPDGSSHTSPRRTHIRENRDLHILPAKEHHVEGGMSRVEVTTYQRATVLFFDVSPLPITGIENGADAGFRSIHSCSFRGSPIT